MITKIMANEYFLHNEIISKPSFEYLFVYYIFIINRTFVCCQQQFELMFVLDGNKCYNVIKLDIEIKESEYVD